MFQPTGNRVLVKPSTEEKTTPSGLVITTAETRVEKGEVIATGNGAVTMSGDIIPMEVEIGDVVLYPNAGNQGVEIDFDGETYLLFHETDLFGIFR